MNLQEKFERWMEEQKKLVERDTQHLAAYQRLMLEQSFMAGYRAGFADGGAAATRKTTETDVLGELRLEDRN